jgi:hypothetical protein
MEGRAGGQANRGGAWLAGWAGGKGAHLAQRVAALENVGRSHGAQRRRVCGTGCLLLRAGQGAGKGQHGLQAGQGQGGQEGMHADVPDVLRRSGGGGGGIAVGSMSNECVRRL